MFTLYIFTSCYHISFSILFYVLCHVHYIQSQCHLPLCCLWLLDSIIYTVTWIHKMHAAFSSVAILPYLTLQCILIGLLLKWQFFCHVWFSVMRTCSVHRVLIQSITFFPVGLFSVFSYCRLYNLSCIMVYLSGCGCSLCWCNLLKMLFFFCFF